MNIALKPKKTMKTYLLRTGKKTINIGLRALEGVSNKNYDTAKAYGYYKLRLLNLRNKEPLVIYQMGKVGSTTILRSLKALNLNQPIYHVHTLSQEGIEHFDAIYREKFSPTILRHNKHFLASLYLRKQIDKGLNGKKWKIITLVREPIIRNISSFFQILKRYQQESHKLLNSESLVKELKRLFFEEFEYHDTPLTWFDTELKHVFDINVFASEFPVTKGYKIYQGEYADVLLLRLEDINKCASEAFKEFLNIDNFILKNSNVSRDKDYYPLYCKIRDTIVIPDSYIEKMYTSKYMLHFYKEEEINLFKAKWRRQNGD